LVPSILKGFKPQFHFGNEILGIVLVFRAIAGKFREQEIVWIQCPQLQLVQLQFDFLQPRFILIWQVGNADVLEK
jgi:hypothetical protein